MAEVSYNPATGQFEEGSHTDIAARMEAAAAAQAQPGAFTDSKRAAQMEYNGVRGEDLARGTGIERTIRSAKTRSPVVGRDYEGADTIEIGGQRMTLTLAAQLGFINRSSNGGFSSSGEAGSDRTGDLNGAPDGDTSEAETFRASDDTEAAISALCQITMPGAQAAALNSVIETGEVDHRAMQRLAQQSGLDPQQMGQKVQEVYDGFHAAITGRMEGLGVHDLELFDEFIQNDNRTRREMQDAVRNLMMNNDPSGLDRLAASYTESLDQIDPEAVAEALDAAGLSYTQVKGKPIMLDCPGVGKVPYRDAVKLGLIKVSRA